MAVTDKTKHQIAIFLLENPKVIYNPEPKPNQPPEIETDFLNVNILFQRNDHEWISVRKETTKPDQQVSMGNIFETSAMEIESAPVPVEYFWESQCVKSTHKYNLTYWSYLHGHTDFFHRIIALGGNLTFKLNSKDGFTPLILMIRQNDYKSLRQILTSSILQCSPPQNPIAKKIYDWTVVDNKGWTPIHHAVSSSDYGSFLNTDLLKLLTMFFDLNKKDLAGRTPLSYSLEQDNKIFHDSLKELGAVDDSSCLGVQRCPTSAIGTANLFDSENWASLDFETDADNYLKQKELEEKELLASAEKRIPVDQHCPMKNVEVATGQCGEPYDVYMTKVDIAHGQFSGNTFYKMQIL